jgi:hypothetical protein
MIYFANLYEIVFDLYQMGQQVIKRNSGKRKIIEE